MGREPEAAVRPVLEALQQAVGQLDGKAQVSRIPPCLQEFDDGVEEKGIVVEIAVETRPAVLEGGEQPVVHDE